MGAGAVGSYYGARLAAAGHDVVLIGRPAHVEAIEGRGLRLEMGGTEHVVRVSADTDPGAVAGARLVLLCVKATDTETAVQALAPHLVPGALVLSLQNGVDNAPRAQALLTQRVWPAVVYVASEMVGPGVVRHRGRGELVIGPTDHVAPADPGTDAESVVGLLNAAGIATELGSDVAGALWAKLVLNCAYNALSALSRLPYGRMVAQPGVAHVMQDLVAECRAVAAADGVHIAGYVADAAVLRIAETMPEQYSSTAHDLMRGRRSEIEHLNGYVVRRGAALGVPTPVNRTLLTLVRLAETAGSARG